MCHSRRLMLEHTRCLLYLRHLVESQRRHSTCKAYAMLRIIAAIAPVKVGLACRSARDAPRALKAPLCEHKSCTSSFKALPTQKFAHQGSSAPQGPLKGHTHALQVNQHMLHILHMSFGLLKHGWIAWGVQKFSIDFFNQCVNFVQTCSTSSPSIARGSHGFCKAGFAHAATHEYNEIRIQRIYVISIT
jgi:hypothetical protein